MPIAPSHEALKARLDRYLWTSRSGELDLLRALLNTQFKAFDRVAIIGGLVRDFAREGRSAFHSDVDLVIDAPAGQVLELAKALRADPNRFGGFGVNQGPWKIDFWALETTWGGRHVPVRKLEDVVSCTFFDWDGIAYDLWRRKIIGPADYLEHIGRGTMDINLLPNPSPMGNLVRAIRRLVLWNIRPGPKLSAFIDQRLDEAALHYVQRKEEELYRTQVAGRWRSAAEAKASLLGSSDCRPRPQMELRFFE